MRSLPISDPLMRAELDTVREVKLPCGEVKDSEIFFSTDPDDAEEAKECCIECPVMFACLQGAIERSEPWGVWGGEVFFEGRPVRQLRRRGRQPRKQE